MYLWMEVTNDEYELPIAIADTAKELAEMRGVDRTTIAKSIKRKEEKSRFKRIIVEEG